MKLRFLAIIAFANMNISTAYAQEDVVEKIAPSNGVISIGDEKIPVLKGVTEVEVTQEANGTIRVRYQKSTNTHAKMIKEFETLKQMYSKKVIFGVQVTNMTRELPSEFKACNPPGQSSLYMRVGPESGGYINFVEIANACYPQQ